MFFKSRVQRDIDQFKSMQNRDSRRTQQSKRSDESDSSATRRGEDTVSLDRTRDVMVEELAGEVSRGKQSVVSVNATWEGKLTTDGSAWLEGEMSGAVEAGDTVFVAPGAKVRANIQARRAIVGGDLEGYVICREQLVVECTGRLGGKVKAKTLVVEDGAVVHSEIHMLCDADALPDTVAIISPPATGECEAMPASQVLKVGVGAPNRLHSND